MMPFFKANKISFNKNSSYCLVEGAGPIPCLFIGPGALYFPTMPIDLKSHVFTFYDVDRYFAYPVGKGKVSEQEIRSLTLDSYIDYYESCRKKLNLGKVALMGPSAIGLVAHEYAKRYPSSISYVLMIGTPSTTKNLLDHQQIFLEGNYSPQHYPRLATTWSINRWNGYQKAQKHYTSKKSKLTPDENLIQELVADQVKYSVEPESENTLRKRWQRFNTTMREHFFGKMIVNYEISGEVTVPTLAISGLFDGVAPFYDIGDKISKKQIKGKITQIILDDAAHSPQFESPQFTSCIKKWLKEQGVRESLDASGPHFISKL